MTQLRDLTPRVDLLREKGTGPTRSTRPVYRDYLPPCNQSCPAGENVQAWLALAQAGRYREAWLEIVSKNPLPGVHGRVCYHPCESSCNRGEVDTPVGIHAVERFLGDLAVREGWQFPVGVPTARRVLVIGAGPCGLSAAYHLARLGHQVEIRDAGAQPGGMLHFGIPAYRLPREDLMHEIRRIEAMGVTMVADHRVHDLLAEKAEGAFDAVLIAIGTQLDKRIEIPARDAARVLSALTVLRGIEEGRPPLLGRRVVVYGGGNTAMDVARSARRLGSDEPLIVYRRDREHMPAHAFELDEALAEGVKVKWLSTIRTVGAGAIVVEEMQLDDDGVPHPTGRTEQLPADSVVLALGQEADTTFLRDVPGIEIREDGAIAVGENLMTGHPGIFAGGDVLPGGRTVTIAVGHGKKAAGHIDAWLRGESLAAIAKNPIVTRDMLHLPVYSDAAPQVEKTTTVLERLSGFGEVVGGLGEPEARYEAQRCYSCGNCFECDHCYAACPESAIVKLGTGLRYRFDYDRCTGCAECFEQCPCHAIEMIAEPVA
ncbi:MAG: NAD(P)-binding protein [Candidatus Eremiobacteraeota bacterium]|nr:NAD(P)-binding protein [Candidatus Eremiobacteraeota bacterium]